jgi:ribosomal protein S27AE
MGAPGTHIRCGNGCIIYDHESRCWYSEEDYEEIDKARSSPCPKCGSTIIEDHAYYDYVGDCTGFTRRNLKTGMEVGVEYPERVPDAPYTKEPWQCCGDECLVTYEVSEEHYRNIHFVKCETCMDSENPEWNVDPYEAEANAYRIKTCVNACAGLPEPEKNIKELVEAVHKVIDMLGMMPATKRLLSEALAPFEKKEEKP